MLSPIRVGNPTTKTDGDFCVVSCPVSGNNLPDTLWFRVPNELSQYVSLSRPDWIAVSLLMPAMFRGQDIELESPISEKLHYSLAGDLQYILRKQDPRLNEVDLSAGGLLGQNAFETGRAVGTGFSAGIDSFCTVAEHSGDEYHPAFRLNHLVVNNVGALGADENANALFLKSCARAKQYAQTSGLDFVSIDSNLVDFYKNDFTFQQTHNLRNAAAILVMQKLFRRYYYSSTFEYGEHYIGPAYDSSYADPILLSLLSTEQLEFVSSSSRYTRLDKVKIVADFPDSHHRLDVCVSNTADRQKSAFINCSTCWKCARQLYTLELLGKLEEYACCFDLSLYRSRRSEIIAGFIIRAIKKGDPNNLDIVKLIEESGQMSSKRVALLFFAIKWMPPQLGWRLFKVLV